MSEDTSKSSFDQTLWNLHRNSLLASTVWLLVTATGIVPKEVFGWPVPKEIGGALPGLAAIAATYAIFALAVEWWVGLYDDFKSRLPDFGALAHQVDSISSRVDQLVDDSRAKVTEAADYAIETNKIANNYLAGLKNRIKEIEGVDENQIWHMVSNVELEIAKDLQSRVQEGPQKLYSDEIVRIMNRRINPMFEHAYRILLPHRGYVELKDFVRENAIFRNKIKVLNNSYDELKIELSSVVNKSNPIVEAIAREKAILTLRVFGLAMTVPSVLFIIAICHHIGMYVTLFPTVFNLLSTS